MKQKFDILVINNAPAFYKINLYNELAKKCSIHVVFLALTDQVVIGDNYKHEIRFSFEILYENHIDFRNKYLSFFKLYSICRKYNFKKIIYGGYDTFECFFLPFFTDWEKNCIQFESSIKESKVTGYISIIKRILLRRFSIALPSAKLQSAVFVALNFRGKIIETTGVGIFYKTNIDCNKINTFQSQRRYLYVGRLINVKNVNLLIETFNCLNKPLTIVGAGELEYDLKQKANKNITFSGFVPNEDINKWYLNHDVFILPSFVEPWGLVVEEAIYFGLPVIVSEAVGCLEEIVIKPNTGLLFSPYNQASLVEAIDKVESNYDLYKSNCLKYDFEKRDLIQLESYLQILNQ